MTPPRTPQHAPIERGLIVAQADLAEYQGKCTLVYSSYVSNQVYEVHTRKLKTTFEAEKARVPPLANHSAAASCVRGPLQPRARRSRS